SKHSPSSKGQLKFNTTTAIFLVVFLLTLNNSSCEARHLRVRGKHYSSKLPSLPPKDVREVDATKDNMMRRLSMVDRAGSDFDESMRNEVAAVEMKMKAVASSGGVRNTRHVIRVLLQLLTHHEHASGDQDIHLDYAQPRTHTPHHN
ncbi:hypothetical protein EJB05_20466, partial [Eragrostis curvula]